MTATVLSSQLTSVGPDETLSEYAGSLPRDPINLESITQYLNFVDEYENGSRSQLDPVARGRYYLPRR